MAKDKIALREKFLKNSKLKYTKPLNNSILNEEVDPIVTDVPALNIAYSGRIDGGILPGFNQIVGPSRHFKTSFGLVAVAAFLKQFDDGIVLFYDSEFGASMKYFEQFGITEELRERIIHIPFQNLEELKFDVMGQLDEVERGEHVMIFIDSIGLSASKKEVEDALAEKSSADMTRAKQLSSIARMITPILTIKKVYCLVINHIYKTQEMFSKDVVSGGEKIFLASESILAISRAKEKDSDNELCGYTFTIKIMKSRKVKEETKVPVTVSWKGGIHKWSGLAVIAEALGIIEETKISRSKAYKFVTKNGKELIVKASELDTHDEFWNSVIRDSDFKEQIESIYIPGGSGSKVEQLMADE
jgi:RecA/RadA recombinase